MFQLPLSELHLIFGDESLFGFSHTSRLMWMAVAMQLQNFHLTGLGPDAPEDSDESLPGNTRLALLSKPFRGISAMAKKNTNCF